MRVPEGFNHDKGKLLKLNCPLYGLKQAAHVCNKTINDVLLKIELKPSAIDSCIYRSKPLKKWIKSNQKSLNDFVSKIWVYGNKSCNKQEDANHITEPLHRGSSQAFQSIKCTTNPEPL
ncbi:Reverse transcriptase, RNA-dependent DNA polymerase [Plasmopara halstedii]|uniref:Reverse transcriptase, RNA-dependent DNA polymerase n=1 Tax=Plasmopara halstedii TaxID=4781 RepID=A0A0P1AR73_PLAHL|nr:Reverse transcriptase, RNA-dependent DNA polymerase [Plasmopara halstedii]CEG43400.1 Reverse transcriptase, RNA-dependent DNA polymerase [Plasmopara halstedii]|eukprot:XP_024579769.1 Reverse transcriptase, RNA-dependent DNA polymerase [Plasmopara halstedii]